MASMLLLQPLIPLPQRGPGRLLAWAGALAVVGMPVVPWIADRMSGMIDVSTLFGLFVGLSSPIAFMVEQSAAWDGTARGRGTIEDEDLPGIRASKDVARSPASLESRSVEAESQEPPSDA